MQLNTPIRLILILAAGSLAGACGGSGYKMSAGSADMASEPGAAIASSGPAGVGAGEWDDNANYREFQQFLASKQEGFHRADIADRQFLVVRDAQGKAVPSCRLTISDTEQNDVTLTTLSSGRAILFPRAAGLTGRDIAILASCNGEVATTRATIEDGEGVIEIDLHSDRNLGQRQIVELAFVLDTTGSMSEEIAAVKSTIQAVADQLDDLGVDVRVGLVAYRDRGDDYVTQVYQMSSDIQGFGRQVAGVSANGGGDGPESLNEGFRVALDSLDWDRRATARLGFIIADAPPHLDYQDDVSYAITMRRAAARGIEMHTIAASGMDALGQIVMRQIAQYTGGTNMFVLRGGAGPQSVGGGDPESSCGGTQTNYTSGNLHELILGKVQRAIAAVDADPMQIAGLGQDESAKPCDKQIVVGAR